MGEQVFSRGAASFISDEQAGRLILYNLQDAFLLLNNQFSVVYFNRAARAGIRQFLKREIYPGMNGLDLAAEERRELIRALYEQVLLGEQQVTENRFEDAAGNVFYYENNFRPAYDGSGKIVGIIVSSKDITEKKKAQLAIIDSENRLQFALEAASQGAWDWDLKTNQVVYSDSYKKLYGFEENDLKNDVSEWITRIHPEDRLKMSDSVAEHLQSGKIEYDSQYRIKAKDGNYRWVMAKGRLVSFDQNGRPLRMIGTHTDITETVEREKELKLINERFDCMVKATHELLWEWDIVSNQVFRAKESLRNVYGINDDADIRTIDSWVQRLHPDDSFRISEMIKMILRGENQQTFEMEYRLRRDNGTYAQIYDRCILLKDERGRPVRLIGAAQDISERRRLEKELLQNELEYHRLIHQATVNSQEKERAEIGKELHDNVNQVLTTTKLYLELAASNQNMKDELIGKSLLNINNVIQDIRLLSRSLMDSGIDDLGLVESMEDLVAGIRLTQQVKLRFTADETLEPLLESNQKLTVYRILQEALNNVLRHSGAKEVSIKLSHRENIAQLVIADDGVGFQPENTKNGMGLKNIQNRIYLINGTLQVKSSAGNGCIIEIQFPINDRSKTKEHHGENNDPDSR